MTTQETVTEGNCVRRAGWPPGLYLVVEHEDYLDVAIDPANRPNYLDRVNSRKVLILGFMPPGDGDDAIGTEISTPWCPSHDDLIATDWERDP